MIIIFLRDFFLCSNKQRDDEKKFYRLISILDIYGIGRILILEQNSSDRNSLQEAMCHICEICSILRNQLHRKLRLYNHVGYTRNSLPYWYKASHLIQQAGSIKVFSICFSNINQIRYRYKDRPPSLDVLYRWRYRCLASYTFFTQRISRSRECAGVFLFRQPVPNSIST